MSGGWRRLGRRLVGRGGGSARRAYQGDHTGPVVLDYSPAHDGDADPGEVVWAWVPYEEDHGRGKDRPVLVVGRDGSHLIALQMTSRDNTRDADEARHGRVWLDLGPGAWDARGRASEVRLDRLLRLAPDAVRREGARLDRDRFDTVAAGLRRVHGW
ncbi:MAG: type II toxin-antitoxin system PemK/MazF family toxin [Actinomycetota bacterium]